MELNKTLAQAARIGICSEGAIYAQRQNITGKVRAGVSLAPIKNYRSDPTNENQDARLTFFNGSPRLTGEPLILEVRSGMMASMSFSNKKFSKIISKLVEFKSGTTRIPISATSWEELIWAAFTFLYGEDKIDWDSQSHEKSVDIKANIEGKVFNISAKAGVIKNNLLAISSYRLTTFNNLSDKLRFIKNQHDNLDFYLICARAMQKEKTIYTIIKTKPDRLAPDWMLKEKNWTRVKTGYQAKPGFDFSAKIVTKMSNQLWYSIPLNYVKGDVLKEIEIPRKNLGKELIKFLNNLPQELK